MKDGGKVEDRVMMETKEARGWRRIVSWQAPRMPISHPGKSWPPLTFTRSSLSSSSAPVEKTHLV
jgi:hypothetical protein